jgi:hypothetical protein
MRNDGYRPQFLVFVYHRDCVFLTEEYFVIVTVVLLTNSCALFMAMGLRFNGFVGTISVTRFVTDNLCASFRHLGEHVRASLRTEAKGFQQTIHFMVCDERPHSTFHGVLKILGTDRFPFEEGNEDR